MVILVVSNTNNSLEKLRKTLVLLELFEVHLNFVLFFLASFWVGTSVADPDPNPDPDPPGPHVFGPPGSGSISQRYGSGSGSFYHHAKIVRKTLIPTICDSF